VRDNLAEPEPPIKRVVSRAGRYIEMLERTGIMGREGYAKVTL